MPAVLKRVMVLMAAYAASRVGLGIALIFIGSVAANLLDVMIRLMQGVETDEGLKAYTSFEIMTTRTLWGLPLVVVFALVDAWRSARRGGMGGAGAFQAIVSPFCGRFFI